MSWIKIILTIISLYFLAVLQNSFFTQFSFFGAVPNLVFIFFFLLLFFSNKNWEIIFFAAAAGFFLDIFSYIFLGASAVLLLFIGFLAKRLQLVLKEGRSAHPLFYFLPLFLVFFVAYRISLALIGMAFFDYKFIFEAAYNLTAALVLFLAYKKFFADRKESISFFV